MALICGDIHGNYTKAKTFLEYKPEELHIFVGDLLDSFTASDEDIRETFELVMNSPAEVCWGNHDIHYLDKRPFQCSGYRKTANYPKLIEEYKHRFRAAILDNDYIISHAGVHPMLNKKITSPKEMVDWINSEINIDKSPIFNIGGSRGGWHQWGGIFWLDWNLEKLDKRFNQIVGHTHLKECTTVITKSAIRSRHICVDANQFFCYNTSTHELEDFLPEDQWERRYMLERLY